MTATRGQALYERYTDALEAQGVSIDGWTVLDDHDRTAWEVIAAPVEVPGENDPAGPVRYALVEQMGHRATVAAVREATFCGAPMLEVTDLKSGSVHLVSPASLYEVTWLTEDEARSRAKPWTAVALPASDPWGVSHSDTDDDEDREQYERELAEEGQRVAFPDGTPHHERGYDAEGNEL